MKTLRRHLSFRIGLTALVLGSMILAASAADVSKYAVYKRQVFQQNGPGAPVLQPIPVYLNAVVEPTAPDSVTAAFLATGTNPPAPMIKWFENEYLPRRWLFALSLPYPNQAALDLAWPNGDFALYLVTTNDGPKAPSLNLTGDAYPPPPHIQNSLEAQAVDATKDFVLKWDAYVGGTAADFVFVSVRRLPDGNPVFSTPFLETPGHLDGTATSLVIPAGTLNPGEAYDAYVRFDKILVRDTTSYPGAIGIASYARGTHFSLRAAPPGTFSPLVTLVTPRNGDNFFGAPLNIAICAAVRDLSNQISSVEFFEGNNSLGVVSNRPVIIPSPIPPPPLCLTWSNAPAGAYTLTAVATDSSGASGTSAPVNIILRTNLPTPPTNRPVFISIFAPDPIASEGTNCPGWPVGVPPAVTNFWSCWTNFAGTNTATFVVMRSDVTSNDLTVAYAIGGTATNGVDYEMLPGSVTIPAGQRTAWITLIPIPTLDPVPRPMETVVLRLQTLTNQPPDYLLGQPNKAAAIIVGKDEPCPWTRRFRDGSFHCELPGTNGFWFRVEYSTDLLNWSAICTNLLSRGGVHFVDPDAGSSDQRYYRAVPVQVPPQWPE